MQTKRDERTLIPFFHAYHLRGGSIGCASGAAHSAASQFLSIGPNRLGNLAHQLQLLPLILFGKDVAFLHPLHQLKFLKI